MDTTPGWWLIKSDWNISEGTNVRTTAQNLRESRRRLAADPGLIVAKRHVQYLLWQPRIQGSSRAKRHLQTFCMLNRYRRSEVFWEASVICAICAIRELLTSCRNCHTELTAVLVLVKSMYFIFTSHMCQSNQERKLSHDADLGKHAWNQLKLSLSHTKVTQRRKRHDTDHFCKVGFGRKVSALKECGQR